MLIQLRHVSREVFETTYSNIALLLCVLLCWPTDQVSCLLMSQSEGNILGPRDLSLSWIQNKLGFASLQQNDSPACLRKLK